MSSLNPKNNFSFFYSQIKKFCSFFFFCAVSCSTSSYSQNLNDEAYKVIKDYFTHKKQPYVIQIKPQGFQLKNMSFEKILERDIYLNNPYMDVNIDEVFTQEDFFYMKTSLGDLKGIELFNKNKFSKHDIPYITNSIKDVSSEHNVVYKLTVPLFSKDGKTALIYIEHDRGGGVGGGSVIIMKKQTNGSWALISSVPLWIS